MEDFRIKDEIEAHALVKLATRLGTCMLINGAEIYRVEDTMLRLLSSRKGLEEIEVVATYSSIMVSSEFKGQTITKIRKVKERTFNLDKISKLNNFSREFAQSPMTIFKANSELDLIAACLPYKTHKRMLSASLGSSVFVLAMNGDIKDSFVTFVALTFGQIFLEKTRHSNRKYFMETLIGAVVMSLICVIFHSFGMVTHLDLAIVGAIILLFPGVVLTNAVRDFVNADMVSGLIGLIQAIFTAAAIGTGVGIVVKLYTVWRLSC